MEYVVLLHKMFVAALALKWVIVGLIGAIGAAWAFAPEEPS